MIELIAYCLYLIGAVGLFVFFMGLSSSWDNGPSSFIDWVGIIDRYCGILANRSSRLVDLCCLQYCE
jgi:hypothetical protein